MAIGATADVVPASSRVRRQFILRASTVLGRWPLGVAAAGWLIAVTFAAIFAPIVATHDPIEYDYTVRLQDPSSRYWFGADEYGRDVYSRVVYGGRISLGIALMSIGVASVIGCIGGVVSGYMRGWFDTIVQRAVEVCMAFPVVILALLLITTFGAGLDKVVLALGAVFTPRVVRLTRGATLAARENMWVEAARSIGASDGRIMFVHVLPSILPTLIVFVSITLGSAVLIEATLSFLGLGVPPPTPSWGAMLSGPSQRHMATAPWLALFPGLVLTLTVLAFNLLGDTIRDHWDPRLRH